MSNIPTYSFAMSELSQVLLFMWESQVPYSWPMLMTLKYRFGWPF